MYTECSLCGRRMDQSGWNSFYSNDPNILKEQIENLDNILDSLITGRETVSLLLADKEDACLLCRELLAGVVNEKDKDELIKRLNSTVILLQERSEQMLQGQI